ncbi:MAG: sensor domain-containing diguanylate cyclase, partial [Candidatus Omnitrophica bacterium]|nr:sensor domain-containing diguanylate cyclase [Candidatus Omnitrophota bacterium]
KKPVLLEASRIRETMTACKCNQDTASVLIESGLVLYIPFVSNERLVALLALGPKRSGEEFNSLELELLSVIAFHLAAVIDNAKLFEAGVLDGLTNTHTRRFFEHRLEYELAVGMHYRTQRVLCLIMADLDHFKNINDTYGHQVGDQVLRDFAKIIFGNIRMTDMFARYGGEEFVIIMPEVDLKEGGVIARRMQQSVASFTFLPRDLSLKITASFGVASFPDFAKTKDELIKAADEALYKSKERGRNRVTLCNEI